MLALPKIASLFLLDGTLDEEALEWVEKTVEMWDWQRMQHLCDAVKFGKRTLLPVMQLTGKGGYLETVSARRMAIALREGKQQSVGRVVAVLRRHNAAGFAFWDRFCQMWGEEAKCVVGRALVTTTPLNDEELSAVWDATETVVWKDFTNPGLLQNVALSMESFVLVRKMKACGLYDAGRNPEAQLIHCRCREAVELLVNEEGVSVEKASGGMTFNNLFMARNEIVASTLIDLGAEPQQLLSFDALPSAQLLQWVLRKAPSFSITTEQLLLKQRSSPTLEYVQLLQDLKRIPSATVLATLTVGCAIDRAIGTEKGGNKKARKAAKWAREREAARAQSFREMCAALFTMGYLPQLPEGIHDHYAWNKDWFLWRPHTHFLFKELHGTVMTTLLCFQHRLQPKLPRDMLFKIMIMAFG